MVPRFIFFSHVVFAGGVISNLFVLPAFPRLVCFFVAGVRLVVLVSRMGCTGACGSMSFSSISSMGSVSSLFFAREVGLGFMYIALVGFLGLMLSDGALFVRLIWWCVMCCVRCFCLCRSWSTIVCCAVKVANLCGVSAVLGCGGSFLLFVWSGGCLSIPCFRASIVCVLLLLCAPPVVSV